MFSHQSVCSCGCLCFTIFFSRLTISEDFTEVHCECNRLSARGCKQKTFVLTVCCSLVVDEEVATVPSTCNRLRKCNFSRLEHSPRPVCYLIRPRTSDERSVAKIQNFLIKTKFKSKLLSNLNSSTTFCFSDHNMSHFKYTFASS